jgi:hypothetical protein
MTDVRALSTRQFTRDFPKIRSEPLMVTDRGRVLGTWTPAQGKPKPVDFLKRVKEYCTAPLSFTFAQLLKEGKKR